MTANTSGLCSLSCDVDSIQGHMVCYMIYLSVAWGGAWLALNVPLKSYPGLGGKLNYYVLCKNRYYMALDEYCNINLENAAYHSMQIKAQ